MIGNAINKARNLPLIDGGADLMTTEYMPAPEIFLIGGLVLLLIMAILPVIQKIVKKGEENA